MSDAESCAELERVALDAAALLVKEAVRGNAHAVASVVDLAACLCSAVDDMEQDGNLRTLVHEIAARRTTWPGLLGAHSAALDDAQAVLRRLGLGSRHRYSRTFGVPRGPKRSRLDSPQQAISIDCRDAVVRLIERAADKVAFGDALTLEEAQAHALPPLDKQSFGRWFALGWEQYLRACVVHVRGVDEIRDDAGRELARKKPQVRNGNEVSLVAWMKAQVKEASAWWVSG